MPRTLNATLLAALDAQNFAKPIIRGWLGLDGSRDYEVTIVKYELGRISIKATIYDANNVALESSEPNTFTLERGLEISGTEYTVLTCYFWINNFTRHLNLIELDCSIFQKFDYFVTPGDVTYATVLSNWLANHPPKYQNNSAAWKNYKFYPAGKTISVNRKELLVHIFAQKYFIFITEHKEATTSTLVFSVDDVFKRSTDWTIISTKKDKVIREPKSKTYRWVDENGTFQGIGTADTIHNLGYLETTASPPDANTIPGSLPRTVGSIETTIPFHLKYQSGDRVTFQNPYNTYNFDCVLEVTEIFDPKSELGWYLILKELNFIGNTEGGALPSTIERISNYTPLNTSYFDGVLSDQDNNLQAAMETLDNHAHGGSAGGVGTGWTEVTATWSYASASTITVPTDATLTYPKYVKIRFKQGGGYKYFVGTTIAATLITVFINTDHIVANAAITDIAYSLIENPYGFPSEFTWATTWTNLNKGSTGVETSKAKLGGNGLLRAHIEVVLGGTGISVGNIGFTLPVAMSGYGNSFDRMTLGFVNGLDLSANISYPSLAVSTNANNAVIRRQRADTTDVQQGVWSATSPFTWATGDLIFIDLDYFY